MNTLIQAKKTRRASKHQLHDSDPRWFAVYTRFKREKLVRDRLAEKGIEAYLPLQHFTRRYTRKVKHVELPLISCYVFTRIVTKEKVPVLRTDDVVDFVRPGGRELIAIPEMEMEVMRRVVGEGLEVEVQENQGLQAGDEVQIIGGQLTGLQGLLLSTDNPKNFVIELENLGYSLRMQVDPNLLVRV